MEELRDERLSKIMTWMQSWIRGYLSRKDFFKLQEQRLALEVVQRNLRKYLQLRTWPWYKLWTKVKPLLNVTRIEDEIAVSEQLISSGHLGRPRTNDISIQYPLKCLANCFPYERCLLRLGASI